jgi:hypothetical protein
MKFFFLFLVFVSTFLTTPGQLLKKYPVGASGCSVYMFCDPKVFDKTYSEDSSTVYTAECETDSLTFGIICVKLNETVKDGKDAEELMISYLDYLKSILEIKTSAGYGKGHTMNDKPDARGVIDYWKNKEGSKWKVKAWTDGNFISVLYIMAKGELNETEKMNVFLNGFRFPGM